MPKQQNQVSAPQSGAFKANSKNEGTYGMKDAEGRYFDIPYSDVQESIEKGYVPFASELERYKKDYHADPHPVQPALAVNPKKEGLYGMIDNYGRKASIPYSDVREALASGYTMEFRDHSRFVNDMNADPRAHGLENTPKTAMVGTFAPQRSWQAQTWKSALTPAEDAQQQREYAREIHQWVAAGQPGTRPSAPVLPPMKNQNNSVGKIVDDAVGKTATGPISFFLDSGPNSHPFRDAWNGFGSALNYGADELARNTGDSRYPLWRMTKNIPSALLAAAGGDPIAARADAAEGHPGQEAAHYLAGPLVGFLPSLIAPGSGAGDGVLSDTLSDMAENAGQNLENRGSEMTQKFLTGGAEDVPNAASIARAVQEEGPRVSVAPTRKSYARQLRNAADESYRNMISEDDLERTLRLSDAADLAEKQAGMPSTIAGDAVNEAITELKKSATEGVKDALKDTGKSLWNLAGGAAVGPILHPFDPVAALKSAAIGAAGGAAKRFIEETPLFQSGMGTALYQGGKTLANSADLFGTGATRIIGGAMKPLPSLFNSGSYPVDAISANSENSFENPNEKGRTEPHKQKEYTPLLPFPGAAIPRSVRANYPNRNVDQHEDQKADGGESQSAQDAYQGIHENILQNVSQHGLQSPFWISDGISNNMFPSISSSTAKSAPAASSYFDVPSVTSPPIANTQQTLDMFGRVSSPVLNPQPLLGARTPGDLSFPWDAAPQGWGQPLHVPVVPRRAVVPPSGWGKPHNVPRIQLPTIIPASPLGNDDWTTRVKRLPATPIASLSGDDQGGALPQSTTPYLLDPTHNPFSQYLHSSQMGALLPSTYNRGISSSGEDGTGYRPEFGAATQSVMGDANEPWENVFDLTRKWFQDHGSGYSEPG